MFNTHLALDAGDAMLFVLIMIVLLCGGGYLLVCAWAEKEYKKSTKKRIEIEKYATMSNGILLLKMRSPKLANEIKIWTDTNTTFGTKPDEYIYTGATVGGIHTGGIHKVEGYSYIKGTQENGKCTLRFHHLNITHIQLTDVLYEQAKNSEIKKYLNSEKQIVVINKPVISSHEFSAMPHIDINTPSGITFLETIGKRGYPTREKCEEIRNWICELG